MQERTKQRPSSAICCMVAIQLSRPSADGPPPPRKSVLVDRPRQRPPGRQQSVLPDWPPLRSRFELSPECAPDQRQPGQPARRRHKHFVPVLPFLFLLLFVIV